MTHTKQETKSNTEKGFEKWLSITTISVLLCSLISMWGLFFPKQLIHSSRTLTSYTLAHLDWFYLLFCTLFLGVSLFLALGRYGHIKLGAPHEQPEFSTFSWLAMLFAAGMGAGLLFWGATEPLLHYMSPPYGIKGMSGESARQAMVFTGLHWGLHAWGIYAMAALCLAYFGFRKNKPLLASVPIRATIPGRLGHVLGGVADVIAVLSVTFGVAGSLGMGVAQISAGLNNTLGFSDNSMTMTFLILGSITAAYMCSASTSLDKGIQLLSNINVALAIFLMLFILFVGPTTFMLSVFVTSLGDYLSHVLNLSFYLRVYTGDREWTRVWTLTYLIWWVAWAPFVGIFIARISRGRTIRQFVMGVLIVPTVFSILWFSVLGGAGLYIELFGQGGLSALATQSSAKVLFGLLNYYPLGAILKFIALLLIFIFLVTSADSASFVLGMMTTNGSLEPSRRIKLFWGAVVSIITASALIAGGGLHIMRAIAISGAVPFIFVLILHMTSLLKSLSEEPLQPVPSSTPEALLDVSVAVPKVQEVQ